MPTLYDATVTGFAVIARRDFVETFSVSASNTGYTSGAVNTSVGKTYIVEVVGVWLFGPAAHFTADAQYYSNDAWVTPNRLNLIEFSDASLPDADNSTFDDVFHSYEFTRPGTGAPFSLQFNDSNYGDNDGSFTVNVYELVNTYGDAFFFWRDDVAAEAYGVGYGLLLDGANIAHANTYNSAHVYEFEFEGTGSPVVFSFNDVSGVADNANQNLKLEIRIRP